MTAKEARENAERVNAERIKQQYLKIKGELKIQSDDGKFEYTFYDGILEKVKKDLESEGYKIEDVDQNNGEIDYIITW